MKPWSMLCAALLTTGIQANPGEFPGFIVLAEYRFDPAVQRLMAEQSLRALPLKDGQLYYLYPVSYSTAHLEEAQIRYLEVLLDERAAETEEPSEPKPE